MKQFFSLLMIFTMLIQLSGCGDAADVSETDFSSCVSIDVVTSYGGDDGNRNQYEIAVSDFEEKTGIRVNDDSDMSSEEWKTKVLSDFITGSEPDVLFYFTDADAEPFIKADKVVSIETIREEYPQYASNMKRSMMPMASDGNHYAVPSTGFWENLFVNKAVMDDCGLQVPGPSYTWNQFLKDCEVIKAHGYIPVACSLAEIPHYWFEFAVMNNGSVQDHYQRPTLKSDGHLEDNAVSRKWIRGLEDIKYMYDSGFFPPNTLTAKDIDTVSLFAEGKAAFLLDGSWKVGYLTKYYPDNISNYAVSYFPGKGARLATDAVGGISMGYYISQKAWDHPDKRDAAVRFVSFMTSDDVLSTFVTSEVTALENGAHPEGLNVLQQSATDTMLHLTAVTGAVQDTITGEAKKDLFSNIPKVVVGQMSAADAVRSAIKLN